MKTAEELTLDGKLDVELTVGQLFVEGDPTDNEPVDGKLSVVEEVPTVDKFDRELELEGKLELEGEP